jgi:hypothetical protein
MFEGDFERFEDCGENWIKKEQLRIKSQDKRPCHSHLGSLSKT